MKSGTTLILRQNAATNFLTPINVVDAGGTINVVLDRQTAGAGVTHSVNALTSSGAFTINVSAGGNITSGTAGFNIGSAALAGDATINVAGATTTVTVNGAITGGFDLTKAGAGKLAFGATNTFDAVNISAGTLQFIAGGGRVLKASTLTLGGGAKLDLADNNLVVDYTTTSPIGTKSGASYTGVTGMIQSGRNGGTWNGAGIITSAPDALTGLTTLGIAEAASVLDIPGSALWKGVTVDTTCVLVAYTFAGDANLSGAIDGDDFFAIDSGFSSAASGFAQGDFNYSAGIDADDYWRIDANYNKAAPSLSAPAAAGEAEQPASSMPARRRDEDLLAEVLDRSV